MHRYRAPSVLYPVIGTPTLRVAVGAGVLLGMLVLLAWGWQLPVHALPASGFVAITLLFLVCAGVACRFVSGLPRGVLVWDGENWHWNGQALQSEGAMRVHLDAQFCLLLSIQLAGRVHVWLWLEQYAEPSRWGDLRRAVYSRPRPSAGARPSHADAERGQA